jgi:hypothetical protein
MNRLPAGIVQVNHRRAHVGMARETLVRADVETGLGQVGGEAVL